MGAEEERQARRELVDRQAGLDRRIDVGDRATEREGDLLNRRGAHFAVVIARDRDRVPARDPLLAVGEQVGRQPHRRTGRVDVVAARDVLLEDVVLARPAQRLGGHALALCHQFVEAEQNARGRVDRHRRRHAVQRDPVKRGPHVIDRVDRDAGPPDLAERACVVGVQAELRRQIEGHRQTGRPGGEQVVVALVGFARRRVPRILAHRPQTIAIPGATNATRERKHARVLRCAAALDRAVDRLDGDPRIGEPARVLRTDERCNRRTLLAAVGPSHRGARISVATRRAAASRASAAALS